MMRATMLCAVAASVLAAAGAAQDGKERLGGKRPPDACDFKKIEMGSYCKDCDFLLETKAIEEHQKLARFKGHQIVNRKVCVKKYFGAECHPENASYDKGQCCGADMKERINKSLIVYQCAGCGSSAQEEGPCKQPLCKKKNVVHMECAKQPVFPHTDEKLWREKHPKEKK